MHVETARGRQVCGVLEKLKGQCGSRSDRRERRGPWRVFVRQAEGRAWVLF